MTNPLRFLRRSARAAESRGPSGSLAESVLDPELRQMLSSLSADELAGIDIDELQEFLGEGGGCVSADPAFKERLRRELWWMMVSRLAPTGRPTSS